MSQQIENQIVKMQFDNASFEKNAQESMSTIEKLKQMLHFDKVNMTPLQQAFEETENTASKAGFHIRDVWLKMSSIIEDQVANKIVESGKKIFNALTLEGISDGFKEYELKMGSIQTIMAGTGESLATVNRYLDDLNTYSDKTIYSFSDMTQNIGKFTNAGVKLRDAVDAIKGIANEAAVSGANANEASRAMYNFAQALSAGYVKLIDWKSIENANMATKEFKETLLQVGVAMGTVKDAGNGMYKILTKNNKGSTMDELVSGTKNFNDSLAFQWMTTEVLTKALKLYATDVRSLTEEEKNLYEQELKNIGLSDQQIEKFEQLGVKATDAASEIKTFSMLMDTLKEAIGSGWAMTWQYIIGDFEQAKALWTSVGNTLSSVIDGISESRNKFLKAGLQTGWEEFTTMEGKAIPQAEKFREVLVDLAREQGKLTKEQYVGINSTETLMKSFHELNWVTGDLLKESIADYTAILEKMTDAEIDEFGIKPSDVEQLKKLNSELQDGTINADEFAKKMTNLGGRENVIQGLSNLFHSLLDTLKPIGQAFGEVFGVLDPQNLYNFTVKFREFTEQMKVSEDAANTLHTAFTLAFGGIKTIITAVSTVIKGFAKLVLPVFNLFDAIFGLIGKVVSALTGSKGVLEAADKFGKIGDKISDKYLWAMQKLADFINKVADAIRGIPEATIFVKIHDGVEKAIQALQEFWDSFVNLPVVQQMIQDFNNTIADIERKITPVINSVEKALDDAKKKIKSYFTWDSVNKTLTTIYDKVKKFITIIKDFTNRIKTFFTNLKQGKSVVESFKESFGDIIDKIKELKENLVNFFRDIFEKGDEIGEKFNLAEIQQAIHDFVQNITPEQITMIAVAGSFMLIALNLLRLSDAMRNAVEAFTGIGVALKNVINSYIKKQKSTILQVAEAIVIVAASLWVLAEIPKEKLENAVGALITITVCLGALALALAGVGVIMHKWGGEKSMVELAAGLVFVAGAFMTAVLALKVLEYVKLDGIIGKLAALAVIMVGLVGLSVLMGKIDRFSKGSITMIAIAGALLITTEALARISQIPLDQIDSAVTTIYKIMIGLAALTFAAGKVGIFSAVGLIAIILTLDKILPMLEKIVSYDYTAMEEGMKKNEEILKRVGLVLGAMVIIGAIAGNRLKGAAVAMLSIAATLGILVGVAKLASMLKPSELRQGENFILKMAGIIAVLELCSKNSMLGMGTGKEAKVWIRLAVTMGILLGVAKLASMMEPAALVKGTIAVAALSGLVYLMIRVAKTAKNSEGLLKSVALMIFTISLILGEVALLSMIPMQNMAPALGAILAIILSLAVLAKAVSANTKIFDKATMKSSGVGALIVSMLMVGVLGRILWDLSKESPKNVAAAGASLVGIVLAVAAVAKALGSIAGGGNFTQFQAFIESALLVAIIAQVLARLSKYIRDNNLDPMQMIKAAAAITIVLVGLTPALLAMKVFSAQHYDYAAMAIAIGGVLAALMVVATALGLLSNFGNPDKIIDTAIALSISMIAVCAPIAVLGAVGKFCNNVQFKKMATIVGAAIVTLGGVTAALWALSNYGNPDTLIVSAQALSIALLGISVPIAVLGAVGALCKTANPAVMWSAVGGAVVALAAITALLIWLGNSIDINQIEVLNSAIPVLITCMTGVAGLAIALAFAGTVAAVMPGSIGSAFGILAVAIVAFAGVVAAIIALGAVMEEFENSRTYLESGLEALVTIFGMLGEAVGAVLDGFALGATAHLDTVTARLNKFAEDMIPFSENMSKVSAKAVEGCKNIAAAMLYLTAAEFLEGIGRLIGFGAIDIDFIPLGNAISGFCQAVKNVPDTAIAKATTCSIIAKRLAEISKMTDAKGGLAGLIFGDKESLKDFADGVKSFGTAIHDFCKEVEDLPENSVEMAQMAADAATPMIDLSKTLVAQDGILQKIIGEKNLGLFGENLSTFALKLEMFVSRLKDIEKIDKNYGDLIQRCADATTPLVELANGIENMGGILADVVGDNTLDAFGETLVPFAEGLYSFAVELNKMKTDVPNYASLITATANISTKLVTLANSLENIGGLESVFTGDNTLSRFGETLVAFGGSLYNYAILVKDVDPDNLTKLNSAIESLLRLGRQANGISGDTFKPLTDALSDLAGVSIEAMSSELTYSSETLIEAVRTLFEDLTTLVTELTESDMVIFNAYGDGIVIGIMNGIDTNKDLMYDKVQTMLESILLLFELKLKKETFYGYGENVRNALIDGLEGVSEESEEPLLYSAAYNAGMYFVMGLADGISENMEIAVQAATELAEAVEAVLPSTMKEHSPSRISYKDGMNYDLGLANGIRDYSSEAVLSATEMSENIVSTTNSIISAMTDMIDSNIDTEPTIRPVLDTSDVVSKARSISRLFDHSDLGLAYDVAGSIKKNVSDKYEETAKNLSKKDGDSESHTNQINFTQNNYSPKALSRIEIYRQTKNQLSMLKGAFR